MRSVDKPGTPSRSPTPACNSKATKNKAAATCTGVSSIQSRHASQECRVLAAKWSSRKRLKPRVYTAVKRCTNQARKP